MLLNMELENSTYKPALLTKKPSPWPACGSDTAAEWLVTALKSPVCVRKRPRWLSSTAWVFPPGVPSVFIQETQIVAQGIFWTWCGEVLLMKVAGSFTKGLEHTHIQEQGWVERAVCV